MAQHGSSGIRRLLGVLASVAVAATLAAVVPVVPSDAASSVRGFDGSTLKVGGLMPFSIAPDADIGARARLVRANADHEVKGVTFEYVESVDDGSTAAGALAAADKLVQQDRVFAIVPDLSQFTPGDQLAKQKVPWFGSGVDPSYCSPSASTTLYGFATSGCLVPAAPGRVPAIGAPLYGAVSAKTGTAAPTLAVVSYATDGGRRMVAAQASAFAAAGFDVVYVKGALPVPPTLDPSGVVQELLLARQGAPPDAVVCLATVDCLGVWRLLQANNYRGTFQSMLYADTPIRGLVNALAAPQFEPFSSGTAAQQRMVADVRAVKADAVLNTGVVTAYLAADMFVAALGRLVADDTDITPANLQRAAASMTFRVKGLYGPTAYPKSFVRSTSACSALVLDAGSAWQVVDPFRCTKQTVPFDERYIHVG